MLKCIYFPKACSCVRLALNDIVHDSSFTPSGRRLFIAIISAKRSPSCWSKRLMAFYGTSARANKLYVNDTKVRHAVFYSSRRKFSSPVAVALLAPRVVESHRQRRWQSAFASLLQNPARTNPHCAVACFRLCLNKVRFSLRRLADVLLHFSDCTFAAEPVEVTSYKALTVVVGSRTYCNFIRLVRTVTVQGEASVCRLKIHYLLVSLLLSGTRRKRRDGCNYACLRNMERYSRGIFVCFVGVRAFTAKIATGKNSSAWWTNFFFFGALENATWISNLDKRSVEKRSQSEHATCDISEQTCKPVTAYIASDA